MPETFPHLVDGCTGDDGQHQRLGLDHAAHTGHHLIQPLRFDREHDHVRLPGSLSVDRCECDAVLLAQVHQPLLGWSGGGHRLRRRHALADQPGDHRLCHHPRAYEGYLLPIKHALLLLFTTELLLYTVWKDVHG